MSLWILLTWSKTNLEDAETALLSLTSLITSRFGDRVSTKWVAAAVTTNDIADLSEFSAVKRVELLMMAVLVMLTLG